MHDTLGGRQVLIVFDDRSLTAVAFDRTVGDEPLTFELVEAVDGDLLLGDQETGSLWSGASLVWRARVGWPGRRWYSCPLSTPSGSPGATSTREPQSLTT